MLGSWSTQKVGYLQVDEDVLTEGERYSNRFVARKSGFYGNEYLRALFDSLAAPRFLLASNSYVIGL